MFSSWSSLRIERALSGLDLETPRPRQAERASSWRRGSRLRGIRSPIPTTDDDAACDPDRLRGGSPMEPPRSFASRAGGDGDRHRGLSLCRPPGGGEYSSEAVSAAAAEKMSPGVRCAGGRRIGYIGGRMAGRRASRARAGAALRALGEIFYLAGRGVLRCRVLSLKTSFPEHHYLSCSQKCAHSFATLS